MTVCSLQFYLSFLNSCLPTMELGHYSHLQNNFQIFIIFINYVKIQTLNAKKLKMSFNGSKQIKVF